MASYKVEFLLKKKKPPRARVFRYLLNESRINKTDRISGQSNEFSDCALIQYQILFWGENV